MDTCKTIILIENTFWYNAAAAILKSAIPYADVVIIDTYDIEATNVINKLDAVVDATKTELKLAVIGKNLLTNDVLDIIDQYSLSYPDAEAQSLTPFHIYTFDEREIAGTDDENHTYYHISTYTSPTKFATACAPALCEHIPPRLFDNFMAKHQQYLDMFNDAYMRPQNYVGSSYLTGIEYAMFIKAGLNTHLDRWMAYFNNELEYSKLVEVGGNAPIYIRNAVHEHVIAAAFLSKGIATGPLADRTVKYMFTMAPNFIDITHASMHAAAQVADPECKITVTYSNIMGAAPNSDSNIIQYWVYSHGDIDSEDFVSALDFAQAVCGIDAASGNIKVATWTHTCTEKLALG